MPGPKPPFLLTPAQLRRLSPHFPLSHGIRQTIIRLNRRNTGRRWPKTPYWRALRHRFPTNIYNQRWHAESGFSQHKRRLGSALTARGDASQASKPVLRVLTHNLMLLAETA